MGKGLLTLTGLAALTILATSGIKKAESSGGKTGSSTGCGCHGGSNGKVSLTGLTKVVAPGTKVPLTILYSGMTTAETYFGLDLKVSAGTLTAPTGMRLSGTTEITHSAAFKAVSAVTTYTYPAVSLNTTGLANGTKVTIAYACIGATVASNSANSGKKASGKDTITISTTAPVTFASFNANWKGEKKVSISWKTATETNSEYFEVERSFTGENFVAIAKVDAAGISETLKSYSFNDAVTGSAIAYYRIKEVDKDGTPTYSEIKAVNIKPVKSFVKTMYPNPVTSGQSVNLQYVALENGTINVELYNCLGKKMNSIATNTVTGENDIKFNLGRFVSPGIYYVVVSNNIERIAQLPVSVQ